MDESKKAGNNSSAYSVKELGSNSLRRCTEKLASAMNGPRFARMSIKPAQQLGQIRGILPTKSLKANYLGRPGWQEKLPRPEPSDLVEPSKSREFNEIGLGHKNVELFLITIIVF